MAKGDEVISVFKDSFDLAVLGLVCSLLIIMYVKLRGGRRRRRRSGEKNKEAKGTMQKC